MVAVTEISSDITEFSGGDRVAIVKVNGAVSTVALTLTVDEFVTIKGVFCSPAETITANSAIMICESISSNVVSLQIYDAAGVICTTGATDFFVMVVGGD